VEYHHFMPERVESLADRLLSLGEPWRSRFLHVVANQATSWSWENGQTPTREEVVSWLGNAELYQRTKTLLDVWQGTQL